MSLDSFIEFLNNKNCLKIICGAGNKDLKEITNLCALYAAAGCRFFDINASKEAVEAAKAGIRHAGKEGECFICVSVGTNDDPHFTKYEIDSNKCLSCGSCAKVCLQNAVSATEKAYFINKDKCIGCGKCFMTCQCQAITSYSEEMSLLDILPSILDAGIDCLEYHIITDNEKAINDGWRVISSLYKGPVSVCLDRSKFGNQKVTECLKEMKNSCGNIFIVQADGAPMSGGDDDYRTTLQAVAMADIIDKAELTPYILISGGTNSKTKELANLCGVNVTGVSIGSYARKIVKKYIEDKNFLTDEKIFNEALEIAKSII